MLVILLKGTLHKFRWEELVIAGKNLKVEDLK